MGLFGLFHLLNTLRVAISGSINNFYENEENKTKYRVNGTDYYIDSSGHTRNIYDNKVYLISHDVNNNRRIVYDKKGNIKEIINDPPANEVKLSEISILPVNEDEYNDPNIQFYEIKRRRDYDGNYYFNKLYINKNTNNICVSGTIKYITNDFNYFYHVYFNIYNYKIESYLKNYCETSTNHYKRDATPDVGEKFIGDIINYYNSQDWKINVYRDVRIYIWEDNVNEWKNRTK